MPVHFKGRHEKKAKNIHNLRILIMYKNHTLIVILFISLTSIFFSINNVNAEEIITIVPGSSDQNRERFFDITYYPVEVGTSITWDNADNISHDIAISQDNITLAKSGKIPPNEAFEYKFEQLGTFTFSSPKFPWMKGIVKVTDDLDNAIKKDLNSVNVDLTWTPKDIKKNTVNFKIIFTDSKSKNNYEHVDYIFAIKDQNGKTIFQGFPRHSGWGVEQSSYKFDDFHKSPYAEITITSLAFQPIDQITSKFNLQ